MVAAFVGERELVSEFVDRFDVERTGRAELLAAIEWLSTRRPVDTMVVVINYPSRRRDSGERNLTP